MADMSGPAYENIEFLEADAARPLRILAEYLEPLERFRRAGIHDTIVFFGSARVRPPSSLGRYYEDARELARRITTWSKSCVMESLKRQTCDCLSLSMM